MIWVSAVAVFCCAVSAGMHLTLYIEHRTRSALWWTIGLTLFAVRNLVALALAG